MIMDVITQLSCRPCHTALGGWAGQFKGLHLPQKTCRTARFEDPTVPELGYFGGHMKASKKDPGNENVYVFWKIAPARQKVRPTNVPIRPGIGDRSFGKFKRPSPIEPFA